MWSQASAREKMMRRIIVDRARAHNTARRAGRWTRVVLDETMAAPSGHNGDAIDLDRVLTELASAPRRAGSRPGNALRIYTAERVEQSTLNYHTHLSRYNAALHARADANLRVRRLRPGGRQNAPIAHDSCQRRGARAGASTPNSVTRATTIADRARPLLRPIRAPPSLAKPRALRPPRRC